MFNLIPVKSRFYSLFFEQVTENEHEQSCAAVKTYLAHTWSSTSPVNIYSATAGKPLLPARADSNIPTCSAEKECETELLNASAFSAYVQTLTRYLLTILSLALGKKPISKDGGTEDKLIIG